MFSLIIYKEAAAAHLGLTVCLGNVKLGLSKKQVYNQIKVNMNKLTKLKQLNQVNIVEFNIYIIKQANQLN